MMMQAHQRPSTLSQFARMWSANITTIFQKSGGWYGFSYSADQQQQMKVIAQGVSKAELNTYFVINAFFTIIVFIPFVLLTFGGLDAAYGDDPAKTPAVVFFGALTLMCAAALGIGLPVGMLVSCWFTRLAVRRDPATLPDPHFARQLFALVSFQILRMAVIMSLVMLPLWLFIPADSKVVIFLRMIVPIMGPLVSLLTLVYYFGVRPTTRT